MKKMTKLLLVTLFTICMLVLSAYASDVVMTVDGKEFTDFAEGWAEATRLGNSPYLDKITVKLFADWIADGTTGFVSSTSDGIKDGSLRIKGDLVLDLNGHTIDRNAPEDSVDAPVIFLLNGGDLVLEDSSEAKTGKITGGRAKNGGGIYAERGILIINSGNITGNKATEKGGGIYVYDYSQVYLKGGCISDNDAEQGGGVYVRGDTFEMTGGTIAKNRSTGNGGGIFVYDTFKLSGGVIEENYSGGEGGGIYFEWKVSFEMKGGDIRNNIAYNHGGGIGSCGDTRENDPQLTLDITGGSITGNTTLEGHGGGIYWAEGYIYLVDCTISGNSAPKGYGGGIYRYNPNQLLRFGGTLIIAGNTAYTDRTDNACDLYCKSVDSSHFLQDSRKKLNTDSKIGYSFKTDYSGEQHLINFHSLVTNCELSSEQADCFFACNPASLLKKYPDDEGYYGVWLVDNPNPTFEGNPVLTVESAQGGKKDYYNYRDAWYYALKQSEVNDVKITLLKDWNTRNGSFDFLSGTKDGALYLSRSCKYDITIDLNGYAVDRGRETPVYGGCVFYVDTEGSLTIMDSSPQQTGKITGGNSNNTNVFYDAKAGAFYVDFGKLYIKGGNITENITDYGGAIYCDDEDDSFVYILGGKIYGNTARKDGGGIYMNNGYLYVDGGEIVENNANNGAGVYWNSDNKAYFTGGKIYGNTAKNNGGGVYVADYGKIFVGGDVQITDNEVGNLYISNKDRNIHNACGQDGSPNKPLTEGAIIGISASDSDDLISGDDSRFKEDDFKYLYSDDAKYFIRSVYDASNANHAHKLYINSWSNSDVRNPRVKTVSVKNSDFLESVAFDYDSQSITLTAHNTRRDFFEYISLDSLIECTYDADTDYIYEMDYMRDLRNVQEYKVMSDNGTYTLCTVEVVPEGGEWADEQESVDNPYKMTVTVGSSVSGFTDLGEGWVYATSQTLPTTVTLFDDWFAPEGKFNYSGGTDKGRLYVNNKDITIDLNGNTISRNLEEATSDGQVFRIAGSSKLTIVDNSATGGGKITGGNNNGNGGAFYIDSGSLHINGGEISGNYATNGAAVYWCSGGNLCITGGVITNNLAKDNGGAIYVTNNGKVYFGGTAVIVNSSRGNVYISDKDANIYHARGQADGVPDMPLTEGACIGIYASDSDDIISGDNSRFGADDYKYFFSDSTDHYIRSVYKESDGNHAYKLYINALKNSETKFPALESVAVINSELLESATVNNDTKVITLTGYANKKSSFEQVTLASLISYTFNSDATSVFGINALNNLKTPTDYKVMSDNGTYTIYKVVVEWICPEHADEDNNHICDYCDEYITTSFAIPVYDEENMEAVIIVPDAGTYTIFFVDYEGGKMENVDVVEYEFAEGVNIVGQEVLGFALGENDKIILMSGFCPLCKELVVE